jgi:hypothetical protein
LVLIAVQRGQFIAAVVAQVDVPLGPNQSRIRCGLPGGWPSSLSRQ